MSPPSPAGAPDTLQSDLVMSRADPTWGGQPAGVLTGHTRTHVPAATTDADSVCRRGLPTFPRDPARCARGRVVIPIAGCTPKTGSAAVVQSTRISVSTFRNVVNCRHHPGNRRQPRGPGGLSAQHARPVDQSVRAPQVSATVGVTVNDAQAQTLVSQATSASPATSRASGSPRSTSWHGASKPSSSSASTR